MKKLIVIIALTITACSHPDAKKNPEAAALKQKQAKPCKYICVMDKKVCSDKPGVCPKCGMKLVAKEDND